jgi:uncharacterized SAM-binding protein YcdF (DUF218 family)
MTVILSYIKPFILPPGLHIFMLLFSSLVLMFRRTFGFLLLIISFGFYYFCATPIFSNWLISSLETYPYLDLAKLAAANPPTTAPVNPQPTQAIVVLGGGRNNHAPEYNGETISNSTLARLRYASLLSRIIKLPIIVSAGNPLEKDKKSEAELMKAVLVNDFGLNPDNIWMEPSSNNTYENAQFTKAILGNKNIKDIYCVTSAYHMPRSMLAFTKVGIKTTAAPTDYLENDSFSDTGLSWLPNMPSYYKSRTALHELFGLMWYKIRY